MVAVASRTAWLAALLLFGGCSATPHSGEPSDASPGVDASGVDATRTDGTPGDGTPGDGTPGDGTPGDGTPGDGGAPQPLAIDPANPRYFTGLDGKPILFHGHASNSLNCDGYNDAHWKWYLDHASANGLDLAKLMGFCVDDYDDATNWHVMAYKRVAGSGSTTFGHDKMDLDQLEPAFFSHMADIAAYARDRGVYIQVQIWNHLTIKAGAHPWNWDGSGENPDNTVTDSAKYGFPKTGGNGAPVFYASLDNSTAVGGRTLLDRQHELFDAVVNATKAFPNVFYELGTEVTTSNSAWAKHWVDRLHTRAPGKLIIVDTSHYSGDRSFFDGYTVHKVSASGDSVPSALYALGKMGIEDTDFDCNWAGSDDAMARRAAWIAVASGVGWTDFRCQDQLLGGLGTQTTSWVHPKVVSQLALLSGFFRQRKVPFDQMAPDKSLASGAAAALAGAGHYVIYSTGSDLTVTLPSGSYQAEWFDPRTGAASSAGSAAAGSNTYTLPSADDWVLHIHP